MATRKLYRVTRENRKDEKFAPQAQVILDTIKANGDPMDRQSVISTLDKNGVLKTRQGSSRVFAFFRPKLMDAGILKEIQEEVVPTEKPVKAAASEKKVKVSAQNSKSPVKRVAKKTAVGKGKKTEVS